MPEVCTFAGVRRGFACDPHLRRQIHFTTVLEQTDFCLAFPNPEIASYVRKLTKPPLGRACEAARKGWFSRVFCWLFPTGLGLPEINEAIS
jgi:hypothetical protein